MNKIALTFILFFSYFFSACCNQAPNTHKRKAEEPIEGQPQAKRQKIDSSQNQLLHDALLYNEFKFKLAVDACNASLDNIKSHQDELIKQTNQNIDLDNTNKLLKALCGDIEPNQYYEILSNQNFHIENSPVNTNINLNTLNLSPSDNIENIKKHALLIIDEINFKKNALKNDQKELDYSQKLLISEFDKKYEKLFSTIAPKGAPSIALGAKILTQSVESTKHAKSLIFTHNERFVFISYEKSIAIWDLTNFNKPKSITAPDKFINCAAISKNDKYAITIYRHESLKYNNLNTDVMLVPNIYSSEKPKYIIEDEIILWDISNPNNIKLVSIISFDKNQCIKAVSFSNDGNFLYIRLDGKPVMLYDLSNPKSPKHILDFKKDELDDLGFYTLQLSPSGRFLIDLATRSINGGIELKIWDISNPKLPVFYRKLIDTDEYYGEGVNFTPDEKFLILYNRGCYDHCHLIIDINDLEKKDIKDMNVIRFQPNLTYGESTDHIFNFDKTGKYLCIGHKDYSSFLWDMSNLKNPKIASILQGGFSYSYSLRDSIENDPECGFDDPTESFCNFDRFVSKFSPNGTYLALNGVDENLHLLHIPNSWAFNDLTIQQKIAIAFLFNSDAKSFNKFIEKYDSAFKSLNKPMRKRLKKLITRNILLSQLPQDVLYCIIEPYIFDNQYDSKNPLIQQCYKNSQGDVFDLISVKPPSTGSPLSE